jgi:hypothetical protein
MARTNLRGAVAIVRDDPVWYHYCAIGLSEALHAGVDLPPPNKGQTS